VAVHYRADEAEAHAAARMFPPRPPSFAFPLPVEMFRKGLFN